MYKKSYKGLYTPRFPDKYIGDVKKIVFRSLLELSVMEYLDKNSQVIKWGSEELIIPYFSPVRRKVTGEPNRYITDFIVKVKSDKSDTGFKVIIVEVKPYTQTIEPKKQKMTRKYLSEVADYAQNQAKWKAAREFCEKQGWEFVVITDRDIKNNNANI